MQEITSRKIVIFLISGLLIALGCGLWISSRLSRAVSTEVRNRELSLLFGAIEAGPVALARLQSAALAQQELSRLMLNPQLNKRGLVSVEVKGGAEASYLFAAWKSPESIDGSATCLARAKQSFEYEDALNPFVVEVVRDECYVVSEQRAIVWYSASAILLVALITLVLLTVSVWPVATSINRAETAFASRFHRVREISFVPIRALVRQAIRSAELERDMALTTLATQVAHDIRSPLGALKVVTESLNDISEEKRAVLMNAAARIHEIANRLLEGKKEVVSDSVDVTQVVQAIVDEKRLTLRPEIELRSDLGDSTGVRVGLERVELGRVLSNLLNNSIEAIENAGQIIVAVRSSTEVVEISVSDNGRGIPSEVLARLKQESISHGKSGTGLGLSHARGVVEAAGGKFEIHSKPGAGTMVRLMLKRISSWPLIGSA